jgi:hypothetical protein
MEEAVIQEFSCGQCGRRFRWKPALAGRKARCACGTDIVCPASPGGADGATPVATAPKPVALAYRGAKEDAIDRWDPQRIKDFHMPIWLLGGGVVIEVVAAFLAQRRMDRALIHVGIELCLGTIIMLTGILIAAKARAIDLGKFWVAVFKLAAISVAPAAVLAFFRPMLAFIPFGGIIGWLGEFCLYFALLGALFDLDESDTWYCVIVIFLVQVGVYFVLLWGLGRWG